MDRNRLFDTLGKILTCVGAGLCILFHTIHIGKRDKLDPMAHGCLMMLGVIIIFAGECCLLLVKPENDGQRRWETKRATDLILHNLTGATFLMALAAFIYGIAFAQGKEIPPANNAMAVIETLIMIAYFLSKVYNVVKLLLKLIRGRSRGESEEGPVRRLIDICNCSKLCRPRGEYVVPPNAAESPPVETPTA